MLNKELGEQVQVFIIYTREAHALDSGRTNFRSTVEQPITIEERRTVAQDFLTSMELEVPALLDDMDDTASKAYASLPDRLYLIGKDGKIAYAGARGPRGFQVDVLQKAMETEVQIMAMEAEFEKAKGAKVEVKDAKTEFNKIDTEIEKAEAELKEFETE